MAGRAWMMLLFSSLVSAGCDHSAIHLGKDAAWAPDGAPDTVASGADAAPDTLVPAADADAAPDAGLDLPATSEVARADEPAPDRAPDRVAPADGVGRADSPPDLGARDVVPDVFVPDLSAEAPKADGPVDLAADLAADVASEAREAGPDWPPFAVDGALAGFCSGDSPRLVVNGAPSSPTVTGAMIPYDCCDGGRFDVTSPEFALPIVFSWRRTSSSAWVYPATADLANLPTGWSVQLYAGCNPASSSCSGSSDYYTTGFEGTLQLASSGSYVFDMSLCLHVQEPAASPHTIVHSMDLYAPHITGR
jgi:hypothetical protein